MRKYINQVNSGEKVNLAGWVHEIRDLGNLIFIILRDFTGLIQITAKKEKTPEGVFKKIKSLKREYVILVEGVIVENKQAPKGIELNPEKIEIVSKAQSPLPMEISGKIESNLDTRLNFRSMDLRRPENLAIFKIQSKLVEGFEEYLNSKGFIQVFTPCINSTASEGGAELFPVIYFQKEAVLRQDPQLHRQLLIVGGIEKLYDIGPSWRAELSHTTRHLCEHRGCAVEMAFIKDETDTMRLQEELIVYALKKVKGECEKELELLGKEIKIPKKPFPEIRYPKIYEILESLGKKIEYGEEHDWESEKLLAKWVKEKYKSDFFFVNRFPFLAKKIFYGMRVDEDPIWARSVDLIYKGVEQSSGGQREHRYEKILENIKILKMDAKKLEWFTKFFKYGVPPHGGFCIGIERFTMQLLDLKNIREACLFPRDPERLIP